MPGLDMPRACSASKIRVCRQISGSQRQEAQIAFAAIKDMGEAPEKMIPLLTVVSSNFEKDLALVRQVMDRFEARTRSENGYRLSSRAEMAAGWWFYDVLVEFLQKIFQAALPGAGRDKKAATLKVAGMFQDQMKKSGSEAKIKMHGDMPFAAPWWAWLMR